MIRFLNAFVKITGWLPYAIVFRTKIYYADKKVQSRRIKGKAIIMSNHTSVYDYAQMLFVFFFRTLRYQMAEVLFKKKGLKRFLKAMGGIFVDRNTVDFNFLNTSNDILSKGGIVGVFPESRIPKENEIPPLPFKQSITMLALMSGAPIIPVYTNGKYFTKERARVIIGEPIYVESLMDSKLTEKENIEKITNILRDKIIELRQMLDEKK